MVPDVPFPDDLAGRLARRLDFEHGVDKPGPVDPVAAAAGGDGLSGRLLLPDDQEHVAVGQPGDVVVGHLRCGVKLEVPDELAVPGEFLNADRPPAGS